MNDPTATIVAFGSFDSIVLVNCCPRERRVRIAGERRTDFQTLLQLRPHVGDTERRAACGLSATGPDDVRPDPSLPWTERGPRRRWASPRRARRARTPPARPEPRPASAYTTAAVPGSDPTDVCDDVPRAHARLDRGAVSRPAPDRRRPRANQVYILIDVWTHRHTGQPRLIPRPSSVEASP